MKKVLDCLLFSMLCIVLITTTATAAEKGSLKVNVVLLEEGTLVSGVFVTISSPVMMKVKEAVTNENGMALFINLSPGLYKVKAEIDGYKTVISKDVRITLAGTTVSLGLERSTIEETVTISADVSAVNTTTSAVSENVSASEVESLPVARDYVGYLQLAAGINIIPNSQGKDTPEDPAGKGGMNYSDRGGQGLLNKRGSRDNLYLLDGMNITGMSTQIAMTSFNNEVILEQELLTSGVPAEYGGGKGVVSNLVTKSGGNKLSGSINYYAQFADFMYAPFSGSEYDSARTDPDRDHTMLEGYLDNKYDTALTLGGPIWKDKIWFFLSGQYRNDAWDFNLSESAGGDLVDFSTKRSGLFGKLSMVLTKNDSITIQYFLDDRTRSGERDRNTIRSQQREEEYNIGTYSLYYQRVLSDNMLVDFRYGHYWWNWERKSRYPDAGVPDSLLYKEGTYPAIYDYTFGGFTGTARDDQNTRDQFSLNFEWFPNDLRVKAGISYTLEKDKDLATNEWGEQRQSLDPNLSGITFGEIYDLGLWAPSEFDERLLPYLNNNWNATSDFYDTNNDGVVSSDELRAASFSSMNEHGLNFWRTSDAVVGQNRVQAKRLNAFIMGDWKINDSFTLNAGVRAESNRYINSEGGLILDIDPVLLPRIGLVYDIGSKGTQKLTLFYGHFSDPIPFPMIHFAGNISGSVRHEQIWLNNDWYTYRIRGSAEHRDAVWTPNTKDGLSREYSITHQIDLGKGFVLSTQAYKREDRNIIEDYDLYTYVNHYPNDPTWGHLALTYEDFGYPASGPPGDANYFLSNLVGGKRDIFGIDLELSKRFQTGSNVVLQYSYKNSEGNSQSDGNADLQGDFIELDPRNEWMNGPTPGSIPHKIKAFGTLRTSFGLDIGAMVYWCSGWKYTESYVFLPGRYDIFYNYPVDDSDNLIRTGQEQTPPYFQIDLKLNYRIKLLENTQLEFFLDVYNITNNQAPFNVAYGRNDPTYQYQEVTEILLPLRAYFGARLRF